MDADHYVKLSTAEYVMISLSLSLVIAKFFPTIHNHLVSKVTKLEHQSLYWGTVIVFNAFTYSLLFLAGRGWGITNVAFGLLHLPIGWIPITCMLVIQELVLNIILFVGALVASLVVLLFPFLMECLKSPYTFHFSSHVFVAVLDVLHDVKQSH